MCILYVGVLYTHLIRLLHRLIYSAGRKFHCPFSHKVFAATFRCLPSPTHRSSPGNWVTFVANPLSSRAAQLFPLTFFFYFISFFGFSTYPTDISKFALQIIFIFISRLFLHIFPQFFLLLFHRFSRLTCWSALIAISHDICTIFVCLQSQLPGTVSYVAQAARRVLSTDLVSPLSPSPSSSLSLSLLFIYNIFLFKMKPQATPNY